MAMQIQIHRSVCGPNMDSHRSMQNKNAYSQLAFEPRFSKTPLYQRLSAEYEVLDFSKSWNPHFGTPRQQWGTQKRIFSVVPFYYLEFLTERNPKNIVDLGCGWNIFKQYIPNVVGIGAESPDSKWFSADIHDFVDADFINGHQQSFESLFSINALHFVPLSQIRQRVFDFYCMLEPNGTGWLALNAQRMVERDFSKFGNKDKAYIDSYIRSELSSLEIHWVIFDVDLDVQDEYMNGNIQLVMSKPI